MSDATATAAWVAVVVAAGATLGVHPAAVVTAGLGAGVGLILTPGLGRGPAIALAALLTPIAPVVSAWYVAEHVPPFAAPLAAQCAIACGVAMLGPAALRVAIEMTPAVVRAAAERIVHLVGRGKP
jgi:hypothetical protein